MILCFFAKLLGHHFFTCLCSDHHAEALTTFRKTSAM